ncbi:hypothetical protein [Haladaptatus sp. NG-SE-30]
MNEAAIRIRLNCVVFFLAVIASILAAIAVEIADGIILIVAAMFFIGFLFLAMVLEGAWMPE